jgi:hypothetical protein
MGVPAASRYPLIMIVTRFPLQFMAGAADLRELLKAECKRRHLADAVTESMLAQLPPALEETPCFLDRLTSVWRYEFGEPYTDLAGGTAAVGTHMFQEVETLLDAMLFVSERLSTDERAAYLARLGVSAKHEDVLMECAPVLRLDRVIALGHDRKGYGKGDTTIDWIIGPPDAPLMLLEVKNRHADIRGHLGRIELDATGGTYVASEPTHDVDLLFRSVESKFRRSEVGGPLQCLWVHTSIKQENSELHAAFNKLDPLKVHCVMLGDWNRNVRLLSRTSEQMEFVAELLALRQSSRFTFTRGGPAG